MNRILLLLPLALFTASNLFGQGLSLSLNDAIDYAMEHQPGFKNYKVDRQIASAKGMEATSKYLPKVNGNFDMRDNLKLGQIALKFPNPLTGQEQDLKVTQGTKYAASGGVDLTQPILDMGAVADMNYAKGQQQLSDLQIQQATIDLKLNISRAYYLALLNGERVSKAAKSVERFQKAYDDTKVRYDNQNAIKTDLNRAFLNLSNAKYQLKVAQDSVVTSKLYLTQLIGAPTDTKVELTDKLPIETKRPELPEYPDYKSAEQLRVELKAEGMQQALNQLQYKKISYQYIPTLNGYAFIGGQGLANDKLFGNKNNWFWNSYIGLRLNVPIFDGLQKASLSKQQRLLMTKNENNLVNIRNSIRYQLQTASLNYANSAQNLELIRENVKMAEDVVKDVNVRYQNSLATYQDVLDAENTLKDTEFNYMQALFAYLIAELEWKKANGKL